MTEGVGSVVTIPETDGNGQYVGIVFVYAKSKRPGISSSSHVSARRLAPPVSLINWAICQYIPRGEGK